MAFHLFGLVDQGRPHFSFASLHEWMGRLCQRRRPKRLRCRRRRINIPTHTVQEKGASGVPADSEGEIVVVMVAVDDKKKGMNMRSYWCFLGVFFKVQGVCDSQLEKGRGWLVA